MKYKISVILMSLIFLFSGCAHKADFQKSQANAILDKLIVALENKDADELKSLFAEDLKSDSDTIDEEIENAINFFDGDVLSYEKLSRVSGGESYNNGDLSYSRVGSAVCEEVKTTSDSYWISFAAILVNKEKETQVGVWRVAICKEDNNQVVIGSDDYDFK